MAPDMPAERSPVDPGLGTALSGIDVPAEAGGVTALVHDDGLLSPTTHRGLIYPFGRYAPPEGSVHWIRPDIGWVRLLLPGSLGHVNCYLLLGDDDVTIVDTGLNLPASRDVWTGLLAGPLAGRRVARIIVTHCHPDHMGLAGWLASTTSAPIWMTRGEWLTGALLRADARDDVPAEVEAMRRACGWTPEQVAQSGAAGWGQFRMIVKRLPQGYVRIRDGDELAIGSRTWRVMVAAGHSPEHACLVDDAGGLMIAGDQLLPRISSNVSVTAMEPAADPLSDWMDGLAMMATLGDARDGLLALPGHGEPFGNIAVRARALMAEHHARLDELEAFCREAPRRVVDCFGRLFRRAIGTPERGLATGEALAHLRWLERRGRIAVWTDAGGIWWHGAHAPASAPPHA